MSTELVMPKLSDTMKEGSIVRWLKSAGDRVQAGEVIAEIQSDKATIEFEAYADGVLKEIAVGPDETVPVGTKIGTIADEGEEVSQAPPKKETPAKPAPNEKEQPAAETQSEERTEKKPPPQPEVGKQEEKLRKPPKSQQAEAAEATETPAEKAERRAETDALRRARPIEHLARVKFGGRGVETGLSEESARRVIAAARPDVEADEVT